MNEPTRNKLSKLDAQMSLRFTKSQQQTTLNSYKKFTSAKVFFIEHLEIFPSHTG